jgi:hypothetical protein
VKNEPYAPGGMRRRFYEMGAGPSGRVGCGVFCVCRQARRRGESFIFAIWFV